MIEQFKAESKYRLTVAEKAFMKKKLKVLNCDQFSIKVSAVKNQFEVEVEIHDKNIVCVDATRRARENYGKYCLVQLNETIREEIKSKIDAIVLPHQVCYSASDSMTDYAGSYRIDFYHVSFRVDSKIESMFNE